MTSLQQKFKEISNKYEQLKKCSDLVSKKLVSQDLIRLCSLAEKLIQNQPPSTKLFRHKTHISNIKNTAKNVNKQSAELIQKKKKSKYDLSSNSKSVIKLSDQQKSKRVIRSIAQKQLTSKQIKVSTQELQKLAVKMENNLELLQQVKEMIHDQGGDLDIIEFNLEKAYQNQKQANKDLSDVAERTFRTRLMKIRLGLSGIIAAIGYSILGLPGLIIGGVVGLFKTV